MNPETDNKHVRIKKAYLIIVALVLAAGIIGWYAGRLNDSSKSDHPGYSEVNTQSQLATENNQAGSEVKSIVKYTLPDGWKDTTCPSASGAVYVLPGGSDSADCSANPSSPIKISVDSSNSKDCNQIQGVQNVSKHICISEFINGKKALKAETIYNKESSYGKDTTINAYYIDTGKGVIKVEYMHDPASSEYLSGFEQLAKSIQAKS